MNKEQLIKRYNAMIGYLNAGTQNDLMLAANKWEHDEITDDEFEKELTDAEFTWKMLGY